MSVTPKEVIVTMWREYREKKRSSDCAKGCSDSCIKIRSCLCAPPTAHSVWKWIIRPLLIAFCAAGILGVAYLYCVPFTNIVAKGLFADFVCDENVGVWGVCGKQNSRRDGSVYFDQNGDLVIVGFFVFVLIQATVGLFIYTILMKYCLHHREKEEKYGYNPLDCFKYVAEYCSPEDDDVYDPIDCSEVFYFWTFYLHLLSIILATIIVGCWVGRAIAVRSVSQCIQYIDTSVGLYGCVLNNSSATNPVYYGGQDCTNCLGVGFGIFGIPLFVTEIIVHVFYFIGYKIAKNYRTTRAKLQTDRAVKERLRNDHRVEIITAINLCQNDGAGREVSNGTNDQTTI